MLWYKHNGGFQIFNENKLLQSLLTKVKYNTENEEGADFKESSNTVTQSKA